MTSPCATWRSSRAIFLLRTLLLAALVGTGLRVVRAQDPPPNPVPVGDGADPQGAQAPAGDPADPSSPQVLTRGPIHEAFAAPVVHDPAAGPVISKQPPDPIQEMPPDQKPSGQNVQWIPGYWSWDVTRNDYLWVSGIWRDPPPNSQWVPGYWHQVDGGSQWVSGTWVPVSPGAGASAGQAQPSAQAQPSYFPPPPKSLESGPSTPQPNPNTAWQPGYWSWQGSNYAWRPGFWAAVQPNWIWMPAHYVWTPSGYLFVAGYWDLPVANRGLMFAPVYYPQPVYAQPSFVFTPSITIAGPSITANLFVSAGTGNYLFGDFYAQNFVGVGITPWFSFGFATGPPLFYDPFFAHYSVIYGRQNPGWITQIRREYILRRENVSMRPAHTYAEEMRRIERGERVDHAMAMRLDRLEERGMKLQRVSQAERQQLRQQVAQLHQFREQRAQQERQGARERAADRTAAARPHPMNLPHSPIGAHAGPHPGAEHAAATQHAAAEHAAAEHAATQRAEANRAAAGRGAANRGEAAHQAEGERQAAHGAAGGGRSSLMNRFAPRGGANSRGAGASRETQRSAASSRGRGRPEEEGERRRPE